MKHYYLVGYGKSKGSGKIFSAHVLEKQITAEATRRAGNHLAFGRRL